jgi:methyltransferase (TIGR00027 family)
MTLAEPDPNPLSAGTAEAMAALRAAGARDRRVRNPDYLAAAFVSLRPKLTTLVKVPGARRLVPGIAERMLPGGYWFETARVRHMDAILWSELGRGLAQLAILGAGFDTRAYRFAEQLRAMRVYEIDHPATARRKRERVARVLGAPPPNVSYLDIDFTRDDIAARLAATGYDTDQPTLIILSGVTAYLPEPAVDRLLAFAGAHGSRHTSIVFDYLLAEMVAGSDAYHGAAKLRGRLNALGEPLRFGIPRGGVDAVVARHGLTLVSDLGPQELADRHLRGSNGAIAGRPYGFAAIAHARAEVRTTPLNAVVARPGYSLPSRADASG